MTGIESEVLESFMSQLEKIDDVPAALLPELKLLLAKDKLPKVDKIVELLNSATGEALA